MLSKEQIERYRRMTIKERWAEFEELMDLAWRTLMALPPEERNRRLDVARRQHELSNQALLEGLRKCP